MKVSGDLRERSVKIRLEKMVVRIKGFWYYVTASNTFFYQAFQAFHLVKFTIHRLQFIVQDIIAGGLV